MVKLRPLLGFLLELGLGLHVLGDLIIPVSCLVYYWKDIPWLGAANRLTH